ncbi:N-(5'-phosphoribosyl)anthranilate isomerase 1, chloroplastic-like [Pyrus x bretschneideri]|uniref:N-(5'-phosphoribosyl)anthranilate isomerase 1, chloroplastic-like n=1 Tax=Pyrus x bretschneideri TaxID=225117 RepID=UPI00202F8D0A|nr:N-(5'-phosphoribosyl)anthranilate isomerase 1, chloroplastic-like [Pyrus x bretschneideri]
MVYLFGSHSENDFLRISHISRRNLVANNFANMLHGDGFRAGFSALVGEHRIIYVLHANEDGSLVNQISAEQSSLVDWILVDSAKGGSLLATSVERQRRISFNLFDIITTRRPCFKLPNIRSKHGRLWAGGIKPENAGEALSVLKPQGIDVSSGICGPDGIQKDQMRISSFMSAVRSVN